MLGQRRNPVLSAIALLFLVGCAQQPAIMPSVAAANFQRPVPAVEAAGRFSQRPAQQPAENVTLTGTVAKLLPTDNNGLRHQLFIFAVAGKLIKVAHNLDLAPEVPLKVGAPVTIKGDLIHTSPQDVLHWTHHDPDHQHPDGFILYDGRKYQ